MNRSVLQRGYLTLISVLTVSAVGVAIMVTLLVLGTSATQASLATQQQAQARQLAHGCIEVALETIKDNSSYTGTTTINSFGAGNCEFTVTNTGGGTRTIESEATVGRVIQRAEVILSNVSPITVDSWQQVATF